MILFAKVFFGRTPLNEIVPIADGIEDPQDTEAVVAKIKEWVAGDPEVGNYLTPTVHDVKNEGGVTLVTPAEVHATLRKQYSDALAIHQQKKEEGLV